MNREFPIMPLMVREHEQFFEGERLRIQNEYEKGLEASRKSRMPVVKVKKQSYEQRVKAKFAAKRGGL